MKFHAGLVQSTMSRELSLYSLLKIPWIIKKRFFLINDSGRCELLRKTISLLDLRHNHFSFCFIPFQYHSALQKAQIRYRLSYQRLNDFFYNLKFQYMNTTECQEIDKQDHGYGIIIGEAVKLCGTSRYFDTLFLVLLLMSSGRKKPADWSETFADHIAL